MSLKESLEAGPARPTRRTRIGDILDELGLSERAALEDALADPKWKAPDIARVLRKEGHAVSPAAVRSYREVNGL